MSDLAEFLLARIADDGFRYRHRARNGAISQPFRDHLLAECEAKRRIVAMHRYGEVVDHFEFGCTCGFSDHRRAECACGATLYDEGEFQRPYGPCPTLAALALPYANHPDYREEWAA